MILPGTIRKLAEKKALIYKATKDAYTFQGTTVPAHSQYFATDAAAKHWLNDGFSSGTITPEVADMAKHYMRT